MPKQKDVHKKINIIVYASFFFLLLILAIFLISKNFNLSSAVPSISVFAISPASYQEGQPIEIVLTANDDWGLKELILQIKDQKIITDCQRKKICSRTIRLESLPPAPSDSLTLIAKAVNLGGKEIFRQKIVEINKTDDRKNCQENADCGEIKDCGQIWLCLEGYCQEDFKNCTSTDEANTLGSPEIN